MAVVDLLPLARAELIDRRPALLDRTAEGKKSSIDTATTGEALFRAVLAGGFPEALTRRTWSRRQEWHTAHLDAIMKRDIRDAAQIDQIRQVTSSFFDTRGLRGRQLDGADDSSTAR